MPDYIPLTFGVEGLFPPIQIPSVKIREIYMKLADPCRFSELRQLGEGQGGRLAENHNRHLTITPDRFIFRDEFTRAVFPMFLENTSLILRTIWETLPIPVLLHCKVLIRLLLPHSGPDSTLAYFTQRVLHPDFGDLSLFPRPVSGLGLRLVFPPTAEERSTFQLRVEPYLQDPKMFFLENSAQFFDPVTHYKAIEEFMGKANDFLKQYGAAFIQGHPREDNRL